MKTILPYTPPDEPVIVQMPDVPYRYVAGWAGAVQRPLMMDLLLPKSFPKGVPARPLLVFLCGGAFRQVDRHVWMPELVIFAKRGYSVASVEYRLSHEAVYPENVEDVKAAIRYLRANAKRLCIDPQRIAIAGESAGGYLAAMAGVTGGMPEFDKGEHIEESSAVQAVVDYYGVVDLPAMARGHGSPENAMLGASLETDPELFRRASPVTHVHAGCPPFLLLHGTADDMVPVEQSRALYARLEECGVDAEYLEMEGAGHGAAEFYQEAMKARVVAFLDRVLGKGKCE